jgi:phosphonopyruvate decarboxylase
MGHYLATGELGLVYMQNSGLGNTVNPLTSLADPLVYGIPMLLVVGWRGEPGIADEPQHAKMGTVTLETLDAIGVAYTELSGDEPEAEAAVAAALADARRRNAPHALVVRKGVLSAYKLERKPPQPYPLSREEVIEAVAATMPADAVVISTTGKPSRELFEVREGRREPHRDLLIVGGMGHCSQIALGVALERPERAVYCLDGDGAVLMHMGGLAIIGSLGPRNYRHVVLNNAAHDSVGGQPTVGFAVDFCAVARACGYRSAERVEAADELAAALARLSAAEGPAMLEVRIKIGSRSDLGRPTMTPAELKRAFMDHLR